MRVLFVHEVGYLEKPIFEMHEFPEYLSKLGHEVAFLDMPEERTKPRSFGESHPGKTVPGSTLRLYSKPLVFKSTMGRLLTMVRYSKFLRAVLDDFQPEIIVCLAVPTSGWQTLVVAQKSGIPFVFRALDVSHKIRRTMFAPFVRIAVGFIYRNADWVSCNNPAMLNYCLTLGAGADSASVEFPPLKLSHFASAQIKSSELRAQFAIEENARVIVYMGSFFYFSGLDVVLRNLSEVKEKPHLLLIGGGEQEKELRKLVEKLKLTNHVTFCGFVSYEELPTMLRVADIAINPMRPSLVAHTALPNKVLQYMASGMPVVTTNLRGLASLFEQLPGLILVRDSSQVLESAISLANSPNLASSGERNRDEVSKKFDVEGNVLAFEKLLLDVVRVNG